MSAKKQPASNGKKRTSVPAGQRVVNNVRESIVVFNVAERQAIQEAAAKLGADSPEFRKFIEALAQKINDEDMGSQK